MSRFDQQVTTKPHRDGGPAESLLMLGYEPTPVRSKVALSDYTQCAFDMGITPAQFLDSHNPMYVNGQRALEPYTTILEPFRNDHFQILLLNNSLSAFDPGQPNLPGVLHTAEILNPMPDQRRVVNSTMIFPLAEGEAEPISDADQQEFLTTELVRKPFYG